jgi:hypothetical protein
VIPRGCAAYRSERPEGAWYSRRQIIVFGVIDAFGWALFLAPIYFLF